MAEIKKYVSSYPTWRPTFTKLISSASIPFNEYTVWLGASQYAHYMCTILAQPTQTDGSCEVIADTQCRL